MASEDIADCSFIQGNASPEIKQIAADLTAYSRTFGTLDFNHQLFGGAITKRLVCKEIWLNKKVEEPEKMEAKVVAEITVEEDMLNGGGIIHGACSAFLTDMCSSLALTTLNMNATGDITPSVSQALNMTYHAPAVLGDELRIISTTLMVGSRAHTARTEIWNLTHHRLVASGTHVKLQPSPTPKPVL